MRTITASAPGKFILFGEHAVVHGGGGVLTRMWLEVASPCSLLLGLVPAEAGGFGLLAIALQYPPVHLFAEARPGQLNVTGARAHVAHAASRRFLESHGVPFGGEIQIELAPPVAMGLGSDAMVSLCAARALAWLNDLPQDDAPALAVAAGLPAHEAARAWGFQQGGLLQVELGAAAGPMPAPVRRREMAHPDKQAWVFVFHFPRVPEGTPPTLEADRLRALVAAAPHLDVSAAASARAVLWQAAKADDLSAFGAGLTTLQELNARALAAAGTPFPVSPESQESIDLMRAGGAAACGQTLTGLASFGLVQGALPSLELRRRLKQRLGYEGGTVMATVADNQGARQNTHQHRPVLPVA